MNAERDPHWGASVAWLAEVVRSVANDGTLRDRVTVPDTRVGGSVAVVVDAVALIHR